MAAIADAEMLHEWEEWEERGNETSKTCTVQEPYSLVGPISLCARLLPAASCQLNCDQGRVGEILQAQFCFLQSHSMA